VHCEIAGPLSLAALRQARAAGLRVSSAFHHIFLHAPPGKAAEVLGFLLRFHQACDLSICETRRSQRLASTLAIGNTLAICRGVDSERFHPRQRDEALRRSWGAGPDDPVLLWAGRLIPAKDPLALAAIWPALLARAPRARLVIAGDGPESPRLRAALPAAILLGRVDGPALAAVFASADLLLHTAPDEPLGNVQLEAAASGLAVVGRSGGALEELLAPAGAGIRTDDLAGAAGDLAADPARRRSMGLAARQAAGRVGIDAGAAAWIAAWRRLLTTRPAGTRV
jgi:glycosyltransferase involved in cell wall biosynthesis